MNITDLSADQLRRAATIKEQIDALTSELSGILSGSSPGNPNSGLSTQDSALSKAPGRRKMSAAGKARIAAAARARWARYNAAKAGAATSSTPAKLTPAKKRTMSPAARAKIAAAARARWAKVRAAKGA